MILSIIEVLLSKIALEEKHGTEQVFNGLTMNNSLILDTKTLRRIPPLFVFILILVLGLPAVALNYFGFDFIVKNINYDHVLGSSIIEAQIRGYFRQTLLQWSAFSLAAITVLLAFTQYRLANDKVALIIGLAVLFSGSVEALHTLVIDGLTPDYIDKKNLDAVIWTFSNSISGIIFIIGFLLLLKFEKGKRFRSFTFILLSILLFLIAFSSIYYAAASTKLPEMWFESAILSRPYELIYLFIYLSIILFIYPAAYKKYPYILTNCIFYMAVTQIVTAIYLMLLSSTQYDSAYNIAYFLKIIVYFIPFSCLIINYVFSYNAVLEAQKNLKISEGQLKYLAAHDPLTNLFNRREFENLLAKTVAHAARHDQAFVLFVIDVDNFKSINDSLGHTHGDHFLKQFSAQLSSLTRKGDILSRIGGDEFTLISRGLKTPSAARKLAERIIQGLHTAYPVYGKLLTSSVSIGIAIFPGDGKTAEELLKNADIAMYSAKKSGKNTYRFYTEKLSHLQTREAEIESYLRTALKNDEFSLYFQPKYNLISREIIGAEILLRWHNATLGEIAPDEFIPVAENTGLIVNIGVWVLKKTCEKAQTWAEKYKRNLLFSINVSPVQFENRDFFPNLEKTLRNYNYPAAFLDLEVTESLVMRNDVFITEGLRQIDKLGVHISIDDFGMGYSSLSRLKSLPIDTLKIDKLFVSDIQNEQDKVIVIDTIIKLAQELEMNIVAEGIETEAQLNYLIARKCYFGQGFYLSKPLTADNFEALAYAPKDKDNGRETI
ncbi:EAL domain-containing protein [Legionella sp. 27cVA30]|nr:MULTISPECIES: GGDEF domain-containing phosphodiesterase [Legionella]MCP0913973.1 EAL domain-containing protein [Legionella sp. 27cVA30]